jgi:hypothetical protein
MSRLPLNGDTSPGGLLRQLRVLRDYATGIMDQLAAAAKAFAELTARVTTLESAPPPAGTLTDNVARWIALPVAYTDFVTAATTVQFTIANLPAGTQWTAVWVEPGTLWESPSNPPIAVWRLGVNVPATGATAGGSPKTVDMTTPDSLDLQAADWYVVTNRSGPCVVVAELTNGGADTADLITQVTATIHLLVSVPGSSANDLPPA